METRYTDIDYNGVDLDVQYNYIYGAKSNDYLVPNDNDEIEIEFIHAGDTDITNLFTSSMLRSIEEIIWDKI